MKLLAIDTSSDACSAAVLAGGVFHVEFELTPRAHTQLILPMVESVLQRAGLRLQEVDALAFGRGPGAFTGVRIAAGVVQGLALAAGKPVLPVSTLAALAQQAWVQQGASKVLVALDARMGEVYWGAYGLEGGQMRLLGEEHVLPPEGILMPQDSGWFAVGSGWQAYPVLAERFAGVLAGMQATWLPSAEFIAQLAQQDWIQGRAVSAELAQPVYLRNKIAQTTRERAGLSA